MVARAVQQYQQAPDPVVLSLVLLPGISVLVFGDDIARVLWL